MVTLRRDVAANANNRVFDDNYTKALTAYDKFMLDKEQSRKASSYSYNDEYASYAGKTVQSAKKSQNASFAEFDPEEGYIDPNYEFKYFGSHKSKVEEPKQQNEGNHLTQEDMVAMCNNYDEYAVMQMNRKTPDNQFMTSDEFYTAKFRSANNKAKQGPEVEPDFHASRATAPKANRGKGLGKTGKIFLACYVLIVVAIASIILTVNSVEPEIAAANLEPSSEEPIEALELDEETEENNWFDAFLDGLDK